MLVLTLPLCLLTFGSLFFYGACAYFTLRFFSGAGRSQSRADRASFQSSGSAPEPSSNPGLAQDPASEALQPGVSILVPCCGLDEGAWENWTSFCHQNYPLYEVLFGVVDPKDPAIPVLEKLEATYPDRVKLFTDLTPLGANHKDSSLSYLLKETRYDRLIFADSDICVAPDYITTVTGPLANPELGMVTCAYVAHDPKYVGAAIASLNRCCDFIPSALVAQALDGGIKFAIGVTMAMDKAPLGKAGNLHLNRIGSDYNLGKRVAEAGYRVQLSHLILESDTGQETLGDVWRRELRWARTIRFNRGAVYYGQVFCFGLVYLPLLLWVSDFAGWAWGLAIATLVVRFLQAAMAAQQVGAPKLIRWFWLLPLRDAMTFAIWLAGAFGDRIYWRGRHLRITGDGIIQEVS